MSIQTSSKMSKGAMLAFGAAALILSGCAGAATKSASAESVHCAGVNSCKGTSDCKTAASSCKGHNSCKTATNACKGQGSCASAANACKGQNSCAGHGFIAVSAADCDAKGGHPI